MKAGRSSTGGGVAGTGALGGATVLVVVVVLCVVVLVALAGCGSSADGSSTAPSQPARSLPLVSPTLGVHRDGAAGPSCGPRSLARAPATVDFTDYLRWGDQLYVRRAARVPAPELGEVLGAVTCRRADSLTPLEHVAIEGEAAYLDAGTPIHEVVGRSARSAVGAVVEDGVVAVYVRSERLTQEMLALP